MGETTREMVPCCDKPCIAPLHPYIEYLQKHYRESTEKTRFLAQIDASYSTTETGFFAQNDLFSVESYRKLNDLSFLRRQESIFFTGVDSRLRGNDNSKKFGHGSFFAQQPLQFYVMLRSSEASL
jgi:hypothetical protein